MAKELEPLVTKELHIYYVLDTSGSMSGAKIAALNDAMKSTVDALRDFNQKSPDADCKIAVMQFDNTARWVTTKPNGEPIVLAMEDFIWNDLSAQGLTELGDALKELNYQLSRKFLQKSLTGNKAPVVIFMSDGAPTDRGRWKQELDDLNENAWYQHAIKIAFALGDDADRDVLATVVGSKEAVISTSDLQQFSDMIKVVSVNSAMIVSKRVGKKVTGSEVVVGINNGIPAIPAPIPDPIPLPDPDGGPVAPEPGPIGIDNINIDPGIFGDQSAFG